MDNSSDSFSPVVSPVEPRITPARAALLALALLVLGTMVGYAFGVGVYKQSATQEAAAPPANLLAPVVKGMHVSPNGRLLAFTGVYDQSRRAGRFVLDLKTRQVDFQETPYGWQDYIMQWSSDGKSILFEREKIPRPIADARSGFYQQILGNKTATPGGTPFPNGTLSPDETRAPGSQSQASPPRLLSQNIAPGDEKVIAGFWTPDDQLVVKTRREPKALYAIRNGKAHLLDRTDGTYLQNRAVQENGKTVYYVVRNLPNSSAMGLVRIENGKARSLLTGLNGVEWIYLAENARWMVVCYPASQSNDWEWELYSVRSNAARLVKRAQVPGDVIAVYWSPDLRHILGTGGNALWLIEVPTLKTRRLGTRDDWNADDAAWLDAGRNIAVAADGTLWKIDIQTGVTSELWQFPERYWR